jgi:hypothetical protein
LKILSYYHPKTLSHNHFYLKELPKEHAQDFKVFTFIGISNGINGKEPKFILGFVTKCKPITQSLFPTRPKGHK